MAKGKKIYLIEDNAHSLGTSINGKKMGTFGDISVLFYLVLAGMLVGYIADKY